MAIEHLGGIGLGLGAAFCQSVAYILSRRFVARTHATPFLLLIASHLLIGIASAAYLVAFPPRGLPPFADYALPLAVASLFYVTAQMGLFTVLRFVESSRVAPLLGTKVLALALFSVALSGRNLLPLQWTAVGMSAAAAWLLNEAGTRIPPRWLAVVAMMVLSYSLSDLGIVALVKRLEHVNPSPAVAGVALSYLVCAAATLPFVLRRDLWQRGLWRMATPYAAVWIAAMCLLFACFSAIGVVFGNIVQSSRGVMAVALGWLIARIGHTHLEPRVARGVFWRRVAGALLMTAAVACYMSAR